ncbi:GIY-YIG nuclease family protein [Streptomyces sp. gb14]|uniref:GIY-YIG nuclease family protein n=1 Tax=Streptomyces sp. gb14 TaxID=1827753 RepID=UPI000BF0705C
MTEESVIGQVHVIGSPGSHFVRIGFSKSPLKRLSKPQIGSPVPRTLLATFEGGRDLEASLHRRFAPCRRHGEWFQLGADPLEVVGAAARLSSDSPMRVPPRGVTLDARFPAMSPDRIRASLAKYDTLTKYRRVVGNYLHQCQHHACVNDGIGAPAPAQYPAGTTNWEALSREGRFSRCSLGERDVPSTCTVSRGIDTLHPWSLRGGPRRYGGV